MPDTIPIRWFQSIRLRLLVIALLPILVIMPIFGGLIIYNWSTKFDNLLIAKVNSELTIAHQYLSGLKERTGEQLAGLSDSVGFSVSAGAPMPDFLESARQRYGFDFLYFVNENGSVTAASSHQPVSDPSNWPVIQAALGGDVRTEVDIFTQSELLEISPRLAAQAQIDLVPTMAALPTARTEETRGMVVHSAVPAGNNGALVGGVLLNQNLDFIDSINDLVYPAASLTEGSRGTTTLFLEDVRISTNVRLFENVRALGTRVSVEVRGAVLDKGVVWLDRAFVVNDWYISAYEPLVDSRGNRVGMLYVGFLDSPYRAAKANTLWTIAAGFIFLLGLSIPLFLRLARGVFYPLEQMVKTITAVEKGDLGARSGENTAQNEVALVSNQLDALLGQVQENADELNARVDERTAELSDANQRLEATNQQLIVAEKLAAIGEITASIAHEINNPIAVIQGNMDVIRQELGDAAAPLKTEFQLVEAQVHSINVMVNKLLQFARPEEYAGAVEYTQTKEVIKDTLPLVQHLLSKVRIKLRLDLKANRSIAMNRVELQQVLINLIVNAIHAMPQGGELCIRTENHIDKGAEGILITISDTGIGMPESVLKRVFDPFFTTKSAEGTGLGLSITQKLVSRSEGHIGVESQLGSGTKFTIFFRTIIED